METRRGKRKEAASTSPAPARDTRAKRTRRSGRDTGKEVAKEEEKPALASAKRRSQASGAQASRGTEAAAPSTAVEEQSLAAAGCAAGTSSGKQPRSNSKGKAEMERSGRNNRSSRDAEGASDDANEFGSEAFGRNFASASSALQGLLRKLGAGLDDCLPTGAITHSKLKGIMLALRTEDDEVAQLDALTQLCELLSISTEESLTVFPVEQVVPQLVNLLNISTSPDVMLLAARGLTFLADVLPSSAACIVRHGGVPAFCTRLLTIEYIDLAEQSLQALEKLSHEHPQACLRNGALLAVLSYIDFFQTGVQRVAVATAANMCRGLTGEHAAAVTSAVPILTNLLQYQDSKVVDNACLALTRVADSYESSPAQLELLCNCGVISAVLQLVGLSEGGGMASQLSTATYFGLVKLLSTVAAGCPAAAQLLLTSGVSGVLRGLLANSSFVPSASLGGAAVLSSTEQLYEVLHLAAVLLPPAPDAAAQVRAAGGGGSGSGEVQAGGGGGSELAAFVAAQPELLQRFAADLLPLVLPLYGGTIIPQVRRKCLQVVLRIVHASPPELLQSVMAELPVSSFVAGLLGSPDPHTAAAALQLTAALLAKLPDVFSVYFVKEGVVHALDRLGSAYPEPPPPPEGAPEPEPAAPRSGRGSARVRSTYRLRSKAGKGGDEPEPEPELPAPPFAATPAPASLWPALSAYARQLKGAHFGDAAATAATLETEGAVRLRGLCGRLDEQGAWEELVAALADRSSAGSVSTFEFLSSGALAAMADYLSGVDLPEEGRPRALLQRLRAVVNVLFAPGSGAAPPVLPLVRKLQDCLATTEALPVAYMQPPPALGSSARGGGLAGGGLAHSTGLSSGLAALAQPLKLRLARAAGEGPSLRDYSSNVVLIEPLATMAAVEDFLWPRVQAPAGEQARAAPAPDAEPETSPERCRTGLRSRAQPGAAPDAGAAAGGARAARRNRSVPVPVPGDGARASGPTTRAMARQRTAAEEAGGGGGGADVDEEDEEMGDGEHIDMSDGEGGSEGMEDEGEDEGMLVAVEGEMVGQDSDGGSDEPYDDEGEVDEDEEGYEQEDEMERHASRVQRVSLEDQASQPAAAAAAPSAAAAGAGTAAAAQAEAGARPGMSYAQAAGARSASGGEPGGAAAASAPRTPRLVFCLNGRPLSPSTTIFQAVQDTAVAPSGAGDSGGAGEGEGEDGRRRVRRMWGEVYTLQYRRYNEESDAQLGDERRATTAAAGDDVGGGGGSALQAQFGSLAELLNVKAPEELQLAADGRTALRLLQLLAGLNRLGPQLAAAFPAPGAGEPSPAPLGCVPAEEFVNAKIASKFGQQLKDVLAVCAGALPRWCGALVRSGLAFLVPFELRRHYFHCTAFGVPRALQWLQAQQGSEGSSRPGDREARDYRVARVQRQKVRISRKRILDSAAKVMELYARHKAILELEYFGEVGTGLGPTLEFYTLLSHELQRDSLHMWRSAGTTPAPPLAGGPPTAPLVRAGSAPAADLAASSAAAGGPYVTAPQGLFPAPLAPNAAGTAKLLDRFKLLGRAVAKALQDCRLLDLPLSHALYRAALGGRLGLYDVRAVDASLGASLERLHAAAQAHVAGGGAGPLMVDGAPLEDLCLVWQLPGYPSYELFPGGADKAVTAGELGAYIDAVVDATVGSGVAQQLAAFQSGFREVFDPASLALFTGPELEALLCGQLEAWSAEGLAECIKVDHGYTLQSAPVRWLMELLAELDPPTQRRFMRFVTGSPRLPPGGIAALQPRLTVVRKHSSSGDAGASGSLPSSGVTPPGGSFPGSLGGGAGGSAADADLPSVMTCANYIKLPPYSSKAVLRERLLFAINEGQGSFDLS